MAEAYPVEPEKRDAWILGLRRGVPRATLDPRRVSAWIPEHEPDDHGRIQSGLALFLTNRECPWRCLMCDLWRHTLTVRVRAGDLPAQIDQALNESRLAGHSPEWIKLYNAGSFFDPGAVPVGDRSSIARQVQGFRRVILENHPALTDGRVLPFRDQLGGAQLEVAIGLETAHPMVLERLNKRVGLDDFRRAVGFLREKEIDVRAFVLVKPPFLDESEALDWACRSIDFAFDCGVNVVSLIATRAGNGALEELARQGEFSPPRFETLVSAFRHGVEAKRGRVFVDLWQLEQAIANPEVIQGARSHLEMVNRSQRWPAEGV